MQEGWARHSMHIGSQRSAAFCSGGGNLVQHQYFLLSVWCVEGKMSNGFYGRLEHLCKYIVSTCNINSSRSVLKKKTTSKWLQSWWQSGSPTAEAAASGPEGYRVWDARECKTLVFVLHSINHFTLLVGYTNGRKWEFYNSSSSDRHALTKYKRFMSIYSLFPW